MRNDNAMVNQVRFRRTVHFLIIPILHREIGTAICTCTYSSPDITSHHISVTTSSSDSSRGLPRSVIVRQGEGHAGSIRQ